MKKIFALVLIICLTLGLMTVLVACGKEDTASLGEYNENTALQNLNALRTADGFNIEYRINAGDGNYTVAYAAKGELYYFDLSGTETYFDLSNADIADVYVKTDGNWTKTSIAKSTIETQLKEFVKGFAQYLYAYSAFNYTSAKKSSANVAGRECDLYNFDYTIENVTAKYDVAIDKETGICLKVSATHDGKTESFVCTKFENSASITLPQVVDAGDNGGNEPTPDPDPTPVPVPTEKIITSYPTITTTPFDTTFSGDFTLTFTLNDNEMTYKKDGDVFYKDDTFYDMTEDDRYYLYYKIGNAWNGEICYYGEDNEPDDKDELLEWLKEDVIYYAKFVLSASDADADMNKSSVNFKGRTADKYEKDDKIIIIDTATGLCLKYNAQGVAYEVSVIAFDAEIELPPDVDLIDPHISLIAEEHPILMTATDIYDALKDDGIYISIAQSDYGDVNFAQTIVVCGDLVGVYYNGDISIAQLDNDEYYYYYTKMSGDPNWTRTQVYYDPEDANVPNDKNELITQVNQMLLLYFDVTSYRRSDAFSKTAGTFLERDVDVYTLHSAYEDENGSTIERYVTVKVDKNTSLVLYYSERLEKDNIVTMDSEFACVELTIGYTDLEVPTDYIEA